MNIMCRLIVITFTLQSNLNIIIMSPKTDKAVNWVRSHVSTLMLNDLVGQGLLPDQEKNSWRALEEESSPQPQQEEVVVFVYHLQTIFVRYDPIM